MSDLLTCLAFELGISDDTFAAAIEDAKESELGDQVFTHVLAIDDFLVFKKMMVARNLALEAEAIAAFGHLQQQQQQAGQARDAAHATGSPPDGVRKGRSALREVVTAVEEEGKSPKRKLPSGNKGGASTAGTVASLPQPKETTVNGAPAIEFESEDAMIAYAIELSKNEVDHLAAKERAELEQAIALSLAMEEQVEVARNQELAAYQAQLVAEEAQQQAEEESRVAAEAAAAAVAAEEAAKKEAERLSAARKARREQEDEKKAKADAIAAAAKAKEEEKAAAKAKEDEEAAAVAAAAAAKAEEELKRAKEQEAKAGAEAEAKAKADAAAKAKAEAEAKAKAEAEAEAEAKAKAEAEAKAKEEADRLAKEAEEEEERRKAEEEAKALEEAKVKAKKAEEEAKAKAAAAAAAAEAVRVAAQRMEEARIKREQEEASHAAALLAGAMASPTDEDTATGDGAAASVAPASAEGADAQADKDDASDGAATEAAKASDADGSAPKHLAPLPTVAADAKDGAAASSGVRRGLPAISASSPLRSRGGGLSAITPKSVTSLGPLAAWKRAQEESGLPSAQAGSNSALAPLPVDATGAEAEAAIAKREAFFRLQKEKLIEAKKRERQAKLDAYMSENGADVVPEGEEVEQQAGAGPKKEGAAITDMLVSRLVANIKRSRKRGP